jgi:hypothetical protein
MDLPSSKEHEATKLDLESSISQRLIKGKEEMTG